MSKNPAPNHVRRVLLLLVALLLVLAPDARAQEDDRAPVRLDGRALFRVGPSDDVDADARARRVEQRLEALLDTPAELAPVVIGRSAGDRVLTVNGAALVTVTAADAEDNLTDVDTLARQWASILDTALAAARERRQTARFEALVLIEGAFVRLLESARTIVPRALATILILALFGAIASAVRWLLARVFRVFIKDRTTENLIRQIIYYTVWVLGILIAVNALGLDPQALATGIGLSSLALGFALRDILSNFVSGLLILLLRPFELGDEIVIGDTEGAVQRIELRATEIRTYDGRVVIVPNAELFTSRVTNNTATPMRRGAITIYLDYYADLPRAIEVMKQAAAGAVGILAEPPITVIVRELTTDDVVLELRFWTESTRRDFLVAVSAVSAAVLAALKAAGIALPEPEARYVFLRPGESAGQENAAIYDRRAVEPDETIAG